MIKIKFNHDYKKLPANWENTQAFLLSVVRTDLRILDKLSPSFIWKDTVFRGEKGGYTLNFNDAIILVLVHIKTGEIFTTIRRYVPKKFEYYKANEGKEVMLVRVEE